MAEKAIAAMLDKREQGQLLLSEEEGKQLLASMGIEVPAGAVVDSLDDARHAAVQRFVSGLGQGYEGRGLRKQTASGST